MRLVLLFALAVAASSAQTAPIYLQFGAQDYQDAAGNVWHASTDGWTSGGGRQIFENSTAQTIAGTKDQPLYQAELGAYAPDLTYSNPNVADGAYTVTLKFAAIGAFQQGAGYQVFNVAINGQNCVAGLDVFAAAGANTALDKTCSVTVAGGTGLTIQLTQGGGPGSHAPSINALSIVPPAPANPAPTPTPTPAPAPAPAPQATLSAIQYLAQQLAALAQQLSTYQACVSVPVPVPAASNPPVEQAPPQ
ncbi:MAG: hypothetical protein JO345_21790 [Streptosporangiaceae bacterium]|nr:hypothetical protein [Streptosporangiaceae bacterium]